MKNKIPDDNTCSNIFHCLVTPATCRFKDHFLYNDSICSNQGCCYGCKLFHPGCFITNEDPFIVFIKRQRYKELMGAENEK